MGTGAVHCFISFKARCVSCAKDVCYVKPYQHAKYISESLKFKEKKKQKHLGYTLVVSHCWLKIQIKNRNRKHLCKCLCRLGAALRLLVDCQSSPQHSEVWVPWLKSKAKHFSSSGSLCTEQTALLHGLSGCPEPGRKGSRSTLHLIGNIHFDLACRTDTKKVHVIKTWSCDLTAITVILLANCLALKIGGFSITALICFCLCGKYYCKQLIIPISERFSVIPAAVFSQVF